MTRPLPPVTFSDEHLAYELQMFLLAREHVNAPQSHDTFVKNSMIEVFVIHLRALVDFFFPAKLRKDDVVAENYCRHWKGAKLPTIPKALLIARERVNKEVAHITLKRIAGTPSSKAWDYKTLSNELRAVVGVFLALNPTLTPNVERLFRQI